MTKIFVITGPSATGKTNLALQYAKKYDGELVNFDSRQIYKKLDIITGKDLKENRLLVCHSKDCYRHSSESRNLQNSGSRIGVRDDKQSTKIWLYDLMDPKEYFSSFDFVQRALAVIKDIIARKKVPILVGGTYLYLYHLLYKVETENIPPNTELRKKLNSKNVSELQQKLKEIDQRLFQNLNGSDKQNPQRLIRKIEIATFYKKKGVKVPTKMKFLFNDFFKNKDIEFIGLTYKNRGDIFKAIKTRVDKRLKEGAIDEVRNLLAEGYSRHDPGMKTIGYQQVMRYLRGEMTKQQAIEEWTRREFQYTKRQLTFMKKDPHIKWKYI